MICLILSVYTFIWVELCPFKIHVFKFQLSVPQNVTLCGNRAVANIVKMRSSKTTVGLYHSMTSVLIKRRNLETYTHRENAT